MNHIPAMVAPQYYFQMAGPYYQAPLRMGHCDFFEVFEDELDTSNLRVRLVSPLVRQTLLTRRHRNPSALSYTWPNADAEPILANLTRLAPSVAKEFVAKSNVEANLPFRLINDLTNDGEEGGYIAMSYAWNTGRVSTPRSLVSPVGDLPFGWVRTVQQFPLPTSQGMFQAVLDERRAGEGLWFDQVCVNQEDDVEKSVAVGAMDTIYMNARAVIVALDDIAATGDELFLLEQYVQRHVFAESQYDYHPNRGLVPPFIQQQPPLRSFVERVLSSVWFERAWCALEMKMASSHVFLVPCLADPEDGGVYTVIRFTGTFFVHLLILAIEDTTFTPAQRVQIRSLLKHLGRKTPTAEQDALAIQSPPENPPWLSTPSLIPTAAEIFRLKAGGNPRLPSHLRNLDANRDKTCIALDIAGLPLVRTVPSPFQRPTLEDECLRQLLLVALAAQDPGALCTTGSPLQLHDGSISWICRPTPLDIPSTYTAYPPSFPETANPIAQGSDGRAEYVQLDLVFLDLPHRNYPNPNFPSHLTRAREIIDLCVQYQIQSHIPWGICLAADPRAPAMRNIFIQTLACVLECGADWFQDATSHFSSTTSTPDLDPQTLRTIFTPQLLLKQYIHYPSTPQALSSILARLASLITYGIPWASGATERTHGPLVVHAPSPAPSPSRPFSPFSPHPPPSPGKALIFAPFAHSKTLLVAVPDVVRDHAYKGLARGWILTSRNPYTGSLQGAVSWELKGKSVVFGDAGFKTGLEEGGKGETRCHRVYGPGR